MKPPKPGFAAGFTLIELLVVTSIIAVLVSVLVPYLRGAREKAKSVKCLANLRTLCESTGMYHDDTGQQTLAWYQYLPHAGYDPTVVTPWVFGGFRAPRPAAEDLGTDSSQYPAQVRPLNKYIDPTAAAAPFDFNDRGRDVIDLFICPGDRTNTTALIGTAPEFVEEEPRVSWEVNGSSYSLNTRWMQGYAGANFTPSMNDLGLYAELSARIAQHMTGGEASRFILWCEQGFYSATYNATPTPDYADFPPALPLRSGWHRKFSTWNVAFADGHADGGFFDTRTTQGLGGTIWQPNFR